MRLTIGYITGRWDPHLEWFIEGIAPQLGGDTIDLIVVDALYRRRAERAAIDIEHPIAHVYPDTRMAWKHVDLTIVPPKPTIWQGEHRVTKQDWWAMSSARNTVFALADTEWVACVDDRCKPAPGWLDAVRRAQEGGYVVCGGYEKRHGMGADTTGAIGTRVAVDNRFEHHPTGLANASGGYLYGCTFALPLEWALAVNGFEEGCDGQSAEDYIFGMNLVNAGYRLDYDPKMWVIQDRSPGQENIYRREDKGVSPNDKSHAALARFGGRKRTEFTPDLTALRAHLRQTREYPELPAGPHLDWYDGEPIDHDYPRSNWSRP